MKRKIITEAQLERLVSLGVVEKDLAGYAYNGCHLFYDAMYPALIGLTVDVEKNDIDDGNFPFMTKEVLPWRIPAFILACNYEKMLAKAEELGQQNVSKWGI